jgi:hypothetical protein
MVKDSLVNAQVSMIIYALSDMMRLEYTYQHLDRLQYTTHATLTAIQNLLNQNFHNDEYPTTRRPTKPNLENSQ